MALADTIIYRLKPEAGDTEPHNEIGGAHVLAGGTITLVDRGGGDCAWQFEGLASAVVPQHVYTHAAAAGGLTIAVKLKVVTWPTTEFTYFSKYRNTAGSGFLGLRRSGANTLEARATISGSAGALAGTIGTTEITVVFRLATNGAGQETFDLWLTTVGREGTDPNVSSPPTSALNFTFDTLELGAASPAVIQVADYVIFAGEGTNAECAALADDGVRPTLDGGTPGVVDLEGAAAAEATATGALQGTAALDGDAQAVTTATADLDVTAAAGTITISDWVNNTGSGLSGQAGINVAVYDLATRALVAVATGLTVTAGNVSFSDVAIVAGTTYRVLADQDGNSVDLGCDYITAS